MWLDWSMSFWLPKTNRLLHIRILVFSLQSPLKEKKMISKRNWFSRKDAWAIHTTLIFMILCGHFFLVSSDLALDWWACIFPQIVCLSYLLFWSWAEKQASNSAQFSLKCAYVVKLSPRHWQQAGTRTTGRDSAMQRSWGDCQRKSKCL